MELDELEQRLKVLPVQNVGGRHDTEILRALLLCKSRNGWWRRRVPRWQAAAACALVGAAAWMLGSAGTGRWEPRGTAASRGERAAGDVNGAIVIRIDQSLFARAETSYRADLSNWKARSVAPGETP